MILCAILFYSFGNAKTLISMREGEKKSLQAILFFCPTVSSKNGSLIRVVTVFSFF